MYGLVSRLPLSERLKLVSNKTLAIEVKDSGLAGMKVIAAWNYKSVRMGTSRVVQLEIRNRTWGYLGHCPQHTSSPALGRSSPDVDKA